MSERDEVNEVTSASRVSVRLPCGCEREFHEHGCGSRLDGWRVTVAPNPTTEER